MSETPGFNPYAPPEEDAWAPPPTQPNDSGEQPLARRAARFSGAFIDGLLITASMMVALLFTDGVTLANPEETVSGTLLLAALPMSFIQWWLIMQRGQTIGKIAVKTKIVRLDGGAVGFGDGVALRQIVPSLIGAVPVVGAFFSLIDALVIFREDRRCIHDHFAGTKVIDIS